MGGFCLRKYGIQVHLDIAKCIQVVQYGKTLKASKHKNLHALQLYEHTYAHSRSQLMLQHIDFVQRNKAQQAAMPRGPEENTDQ